MNDGAVERGVPHADFFVLRAPLLSIATLSRWAEGIDAPTALAEEDEQLEHALTADRALLRTRLAELVTDDQIADSIQHATPDLADSLPRWRADPDSKRGRSAERSLVRYVTRLAFRPELFGVAGGYLIGQFASDARLELHARSELQVRARVDSVLLQEIVRRAAADAADDPAFVVRRNGGIYQAGGRLRVAARVPGATKHRLVAMRATPSIDLALATAADGATVGELIAALVAAGSPADHAPTVIRRLIASDLLVPDAQVTVTGPEPTTQALTALDAVPGAGAHAAAVRNADAKLSAAARIGTEAVTAVMDALAPTGVDVKRRRCIQVDARRPGDVSLPACVLTEMRRAIDLLSRIVPPAPVSLAAFKEAFERRFATRSVPLLEALDPDFGIRLDTGFDAAPAGTADAAARKRRRALLRLVERGSHAPDSAVVLDEADVAALEQARPVALPDAFAMITRLAAHDASAVTAGEFMLVEPFLFGPSGARVLGRLCRGDPELETHVRRHLSLEASHDPDVVFAELSLTPETDAGLNITQRPVLRDWEIEYGGGSGADRARRLDAADLLVSVESGEVVLRSETLGRRVMPSSTTAMNPMWVSLPAARFLLSIPHQRTTGSLRWGWDELDDLPELPRITYGRAILSLRRWNVTDEELKAVEAGTDAGGFRRLQEWRVRRGLPRVVTFEHPKNPTLVDFDNVLSVDAFLAGTNDVGVIRLIETPLAEMSPVQGPDGRYTHELIVPFTLGQDRTGERRPDSPPRRVREDRRRFAPGSEWLYANLYGPVASADRVLVDHVAPLRERLRDAGVTDRWFFIRYADPERHLRVRFHGRPEDLLQHAVPASHEALAPALDEGLLWRVSLDTYEREVERYGGLEGVELMEMIAELDSDAVIELLRQPMTAIERRQLAVASVAALYADAGLPVEARRRCSVLLREAWSPPGTRSLGALLGADERAERADVAAMVAALEHEDAEPRIAVLRRRSLKLRPVLEQLRALDDKGTLEEPLDQIMCSLAHMAINRLLRRGANHDELRVHDALARLYDTQMARERTGPSLRRR